MKRDAACRVLVLAVLAASPAAAGVYEAPSPEPTPEETVMLEHMNRLRADPVADMNRIAPEEGPKAINPHIPVDWGMFRREMKELKPAPPLVFDLRLLDAARKHSHYMILNQLTHVEDPGRPGFTGQSFSDRIRKAGYEGGAGAENCFRDAPGPWVCHASFTVDFGDGGPGGMQPGRGHRMNMMNAGLREVGIGAVPHAGRLSVTHNFGNRGGRFAGGVVYVDLNCNGFYDIGEGRGDIEIRASDGSSARTWSSGAFTLRLKAEGPVTLKAMFEDLSYSQSYESGDANVKFDWIIPQKAELDLADRLVKSAEAVKDPKSSRYFKELVALWMGTSRLRLDEPRRRKIDSLAGEVGRELDGHMKAVLEAVDALDAKGYSDFKRSLDRHRRPYDYTAASGWFKEAGVTAQAAVMASNYEKQAARLPKKAGRDLVKLLEATRDQTRSAEFRGRIDGLVAKVKSLAGAR